MLSVSSCTCLAAGRQNEMQKICGEMTSNNKNSPRNDSYGEFYSEDFYEKQAKESFNSAQVVLPIVFEVLPKINSAVDFGCGAGAWLSVLKSMGVNEIKGYDGSWAEKSLIIPPECFTAVEFNKETIKTDKKYDLAISLEVAEHLPERSAKMLVETITNVSDVVLFSAAIPLQGGSNHINEQWQSYWYNMFGEYGYVGTDFLRKRILNEKKVQIWYKQNIILYVKREKLKVIAIPEEHFSGKQIDFVYPEFGVAIKYWNKYDNVNVSLLGLCKLLFKRINRYILEGNI